MMNEKKLCWTCKKLAKVDKNGYITCPMFPDKEEAMSCGMTVFLHCYCSDHEEKQR